VGCVVSALILRRRLGGLGGRHILTTHVKIAIATVPAFLFAWGVHELSRKAFDYEMIASLGVLIVGGTGAVAVYGLVARRLRVAEVETLYRTVMARLPGRGAS